MSDVKTYSDTTTAGNDTSVQSYVFDVSHLGEADNAALQKSLENKNIQFELKDGNIIINADSVLNSAKLVNELRENYGISSLDIIGLDDPHTEIMKDISQESFLAIAGKDGKNMSMSDLIAELLASIIVTLAEKRSALAETKQIFANVELNMSQLAYAFAREYVEQKFQADQVKAWGEIISGGVAAFMAVVNFAVTAKAASSNSSGSAKVSMDSPNQNPAPANQENIAPEQTNEAPKADPDAAPEQQKLQQDQNPNNNPAANNQNNQDNVDAGQKDQVDKQLQDGLDKQEAMNKAEKNAKTTADDDKPEKKQIGRGPLDGLDQISKGTSNLIAAEHERDSMLAKIEQDKLEAFIGGLRGQISGLDDSIRSCKSLIDTIIGLIKEVYTSAHDTAMSVSRNI
ncbi:MAG: hypothetical protein LBT64_00150 [Puniceicoccales bacterium]|jgi:hypothetical protein|nr:hypothetical protein [Puniceicoccales bacterium]